MLKIRLMRIGDRKKPFYRVVIVDERNKRTGGYIENVGTYNPLTEPKEIKLNKERIEHWIKMGAQKSDGFLRIIGEAPQKKPRKPKKEKHEAGDKKQEVEAKAEGKTAEEVKTGETSKEEPATQELQAAEEVKTEEKPSQETPAADTKAIEEPKDESVSENKEADGAPNKEGAKTE